MSQEQIKMHHYLVHGTVVFVHKDDPENMLQAERNAMVLGKDGLIRERNLAMCHQALIMGLFNDLDQSQPGVSEKHQAVNVIIHNIIPLGLMTVEEFRQAPEGTKKAEVSDLTQALLERANTGNMQ